MEETSPTSSVSRVVRKSESWHVWFGDMESFVRLAEVVGSVFATRPSRYLERAEKSPRWDTDEYERNATLDAMGKMGPKMVYDDGQTTISGPIPEVCKEIDPRVLKFVNIVGQAPTYPSNDCQDKLLVQFNSYAGCTFAIESDDERWVAEAFGRIFDESRKGRSSWWASMNARWVGHFCVTLLILNNLALLTLIYFATQKLVWLFLTLIILLLMAISLVSRWVSRLPLFEIHAQGGRPKIVNFIMTAAFTFPSTILTAILVNLATA